MGDLRAIAQCFRWGVVIAGDGKDGSALIQFVDDVGNRFFLFPR